MLLQENVTAVLTSSPTDVLSHVAIRARSQGVLLATCFDEAAFTSIKQLEGKHVQLAVDATGAVAATESAVPAASDDALPKQGKASTRITGQELKVCVNMHRDGPFQTWEQLGLSWNLHAPLRCCICCKAPLKAVQHCCAWS